jgi:hypothetical protein
VSAPDRGEHRRLAAAGLACARAGDFFAAHEEWEELWLDLRGEERIWLQALIQAVVALHHAAAGNAAGAASLKEKASRKLERLAADRFAVPDWVEGIGLPSPLDLLGWLRRWDSAAAALRCIDGFPF